MSAPSKRVAQYLRVSTDHQRYALAGQAAHIAAYAERCGLTIVRTYVDAGVSGLTREGRNGLQQLLADVVGGKADYQTILVYDVSRWGRFQNPDESAHYEFVCRAAGVGVQYCAEAFGDGGVSSALLKQIKRVMAAEYSRQLSTTVAGAQRRYAARGLWQGGPAGYGLRRAVVGGDGEIKAVLERGEHKATASDKVVLILGPPEEQAVIARIYRLFLEDRITRTAIVRLLNNEGVPYGDERPWTYQRVANVLTNPVYAGEQAFGKTARPLGGRREKQAPSDWVRAKTQTQVIAPTSQAKAAKLIASKMMILSDGEMLARLKALARRKGRLSTSLIEDAEDLPCAGTYANRFGSLMKAYQLIGYDYEAIRAKRRPAELVKARRTRRLRSRTR